MTKKLFVGGLSWGTKDEQLKAAFETFGTVAEAKVILDIETGRSRGFGFVTFPDDDAGTRAIQEMDGKDLDGRSIRVNEAQERSRAPREGGGGRPGGPGGGGGGRPMGGRPSGGGGGGGGGRSFRSEDRPSAGRGGPKRRGRPGEGKGDDRFSRRRNTQQGKRSRPFDEFGGGDEGGYSDSYDD